MPAKLCTGETATVPRIRESRAYCEGRRAAVTGLALGDNPHPVATRDHDLWDSGHASYNGGAGSALPRDCCADLAYGG
jgi:hypothetical protein